jgi:hypothetical protein
MQKLLTALIVSVNLFIANAQNTVPLLSIPISVKNGSNTIELYLGIDNTATDGIDTQLGEGELPPLPPYGAFDARLVGTDISIPLGNGSLKDFRQGTIPFSQTLTHELFIQKGSSDTSAISWNLPVGVTGVLQDLFGGVAINVSLGGNGNYMLKNPLISNLKIILNYNIISGINESPNPSDFCLYQNFPNPFNPETKIKFFIPYRSLVQLNVFDMLGNKVLELVDSELERGTYEEIIRSDKLSSGIYVYELRADNFTKSNKMILLK